MTNETSYNEAEDQYAGADRDTRTYRHVHLERTRPQLSKIDDDAAGKEKLKARIRSEAKARSRSKESKLKVIPLGGLDAIGKNMTVFECGNDMIVDDAGLMFPDDSHPGVDLILPDYTYVLENAHKLRGIVITHGHEDHTGSLPYLLKDLEQEVTIYATSMTLGLIEGKFAEHKVDNAKLVEINPGETIFLGCMAVEFFSVNHSIPGAVGLFLQTPAGNVLHTGDFKLDQSPIDGVMTDFGALARFGEIGVDLMMSDSTNAMNKQFTPSESAVGPVLSQIISQATGKVVIASFASHIHRMQQICDAAVANGRKVVVTGRSMVQNVDIARRLGYLDIRDEDIVDAYYLEGLPSDKIVVMCTGSQGEPLSALSRIAKGAHKTIRLCKDETVIISATPVPGNEKAVTKIVNELAKLGVNVFDKNRAQVHVSGHAGSEELKLVLSIVRPTAFMPVHGEALHLRAHADLARATGVAEENIFICENGETLELDSEGVRTGEFVQSGVVFVDGFSVGDMSQSVLDERSSLGQHGCCSIAAAVSTSKAKIMGDVQVELRGVPGCDDDYLEIQLRSCVASALSKALAKGLQSKELSKAARDAAHSLIWERTKTRPMVVAHVVIV